MLTNLELYGTDKVPPVPVSVANERIALLQANLSVHIKLPLKEQSSYTICKILDGISFWRKLSCQEEVGL